MTHQPMADGLQELGKKGMGKTDKAMVDGSTGRSACATKVDCLAGEGACGPKFKFGLGLGLGLDWVTQG